MNQIRDIYEEGEEVVAVTYETHPENPRADDNCSVLWCWHRRYELGDKTDKPNQIESLEELKAELDADVDVLIVKPLYLLDHSGLSISVSDFNDRWDSGCVGLGFVRESHLKALGWAPEDITAEKADELLKSEVDLYDQYLTGETYTFTKYVGGVEDGDAYAGTYYGYDLMENGLLYEAFGGEERAKKAKCVGSEPQDLTNARERTRLVFESGAHPARVTLPIVDRPGGFAEFPFPNVAAAREFLKPWYSIKSEQDPVIHIEEKEP